MTTIKVLGSGCKSCQRTAHLIEQTAQQLGKAIQIENVESPAQIMAYGVMSTPAVVIDETLVHKGGVPNEAQIRDWLASL